MQSQWSKDRNRMFAESKKGISTVSFEQILIYLYGIPLLLKQIGST